MAEDPDAPIENDSNHGNEEENANNKIQVEEEEKNSLEEELVAAIRKNDIDKMKVKLLEGANVNKMDSYGTKSKITPLFIAVSKQNLEAVQLLLKFKADASTQSFPNGTAPIHVAAQYANPQIVKLLLDNGANPVINDNNGKNPLQMIGHKLEPYGKKLTKEKIIERTSEVQLLLLMAGTQAANQQQIKIDNEIENAESGLKGLKMESNQRIKKVEKVLDKGKFESTHPYYVITKNRLTVWSRTNGTIEDYLGKRYIKVKIPSYVDKDNFVHLDLSRIQQFQIVIAKELLEKSGLSLEPENKPKNAKYVMS